MDGASYCEGGTGHAPLIVAPTSGGTGSSTGDGLPTSKGSAYGVMSLAPPFWLPGDTGGVHKRPPPPLPWEVLNGKAHAPLKAPPAFKAPPPAPDVPFKATAVSMHAYKAPPTAPVPSGKDTWRQSTASRDRRGSTSQVLSHWPYSEGATNKLGQEPKLGEASGAGEPANEEP